MAESIAEEIAKIIEKHSITFESFGITETVIPEENLSPMSREITEYIDGIFKACQYRAKRTSGDFEDQGSNSVELKPLPSATQFDPSKSIAPESRHRGRDYRAYLSDRSYMQKEIDLTSRVQAISQMTFDQIIDAPTLDHDD